MSNSESEHDANDSSDDKPTCLSPPPPPPRPFYPQATVVDTDDDVSSISPLSSLLFLQSSQGLLGKAALRLVIQGTLILCLWKKMQHFSVICALSENVSISSKRHTFFSPIKFAKSCNLTLFS